MGTRSDIIVEGTDGKFRRIYCHWDGYLGGVGRTLFDHYTTQAKCEALAALGSLSSLREEIGVKHPFDSPMFGTKGHENYEKKYGKMCLAYGRDRGETEVDAFVGDTLQAAWPAEDTWTEFTYVWRKDAAKWFVCSADAGTQALVDLGDALLGRIDVDANVKVPFAGITIGKHKKPDAPDVPPLDTFSKGK
jgi:hypothetical protein